MRTKHRDIVRATAAAESRRSGSSNSGVAPFQDKEGSPPHTSMIDCSELTKDQSQNSYHGSSRLRRSYLDVAMEREEQDSMKDKSVLDEIDLEQDQDGSEDWEEDSLSSQDPEEAIRKAFLFTFLGTYCGGVDILLGAIFEFFKSIWTFAIVCFKKLSGNNSNSDEGKNEMADMVADALDIDPIAVSNNFSTAFGGTTGASGSGATGGASGAASGAVSGSAATGGAATGGAAGQAGMAAQMGAMAAQSAASASAAASSTAAAATAAASTVASTVTGAVASAGVAAQTGMAVGAVTVATVAVTSGVVITQPTFSSSNVTDTFEPPVCSSETIQKVGYVELHIQGMHSDTLLKHQDEVELLFRDIYNSISGMCLDPFSRVMHTAELQNWTTQDTAVFLGEEDILVGGDTPAGNSSLFNQTNQMELVPVTTTYWTASVACNGW